MSGKQIGRAYLRGCRQSLAIAVVGGILGVALVAFALYMAQYATPENEFVIMAIVGVVQMALMGIMVLFALWWIRRRGKRLDRGFGTAPGTQVMGNVRQWKGEVRGRRFNAWVARGPRLELYLESDVRTRAAIRRVGPAIQAFGRLLDSTIVPIESPGELADCEVLARDADWMRRLVRRPGIARTAAELMTPSERVVPGIRFGPASIGYVRQFLPLSEVTEVNIDAWLDQLSTLADGVDAMGPSRDGLQPSKLETWSRTSRRLPVNPIWIGLGCGMVAVAVIIVVVLVIVAILES
ncbi:MAG: hypothetical protein ACE5GX_08005 [Thermoanaerobaculia bacterium]